MAKDINLNPLDDRIVVEPVAAEEKTAGGIVLPDTAKEKPCAALSWPSGRASCWTAASRGSCRSPLATR